MADRHEVFFTPFDIPIDQENADYAVAGSIADLAGFSEGTVVTHRSPSHLPNASRTVFVFSGERLHELGFDSEPEVLLTHSPDLLVDQTLNPDGFFVNYGGSIAPEVVEREMIQAKIYEVAEELKSRDQNS